MVSDVPVVICDEENMRGVDYQTKDPNGISLLIMAPFSSHRAYEQALGRVGRYGAACRRYVISSLKGRLVDSSAIDFRTD